jgi:hypothetical protein
MDYLTKVNLHHSCLPLTREVDFCVTKRRRERLKSENSFLSLSHLKNDSSLVRGSR